MRKKRGMAVVGLLICMAGFVFSGFAVQAEDTPLEMVNLKDGVTFELNEEGQIQFINLHGNSVIIKDVPAAEGETSKYHNIYIDKNRNGVLDEDENNKVKLQYPDGTDVTDLPAGMPIYGLYQAKSTTPLRITVTGTGYGEIVGVCAGELLVTGEEPAVFMDMDVNSLGRAVGVQAGTVSTVKMSLKGTATNCIGASSSTVDASGSKAAAILMDINCTSLSTCSAAQGSNITATAGQAVVVNIGSGQIGECYGAQGGSIHVSGNAPAAVVMDVDCTSLGKGIGTQGCKVTTAGTVEKAVETTIRGGNISSYYGVQGESVHIGEGTATAVAVNVTGGSVSGFFGVDQADILSESDGKTAVDIVISGNGRISGGLIAAQGSLSSSAPLMLKGDVKLAVTTEASGDSNVYSGYLLQNNIVVDGSVTVNAEKMRLGGQFYLLHTGVTVSEDVSLIMGEKSQGYLNGLDYSTVEGNVTMEVYGADNSNRAGNIIVANRCASNKDYAIGGNLTVTMRGGYVNTFECAENGANVKGNLTFCALEGGISRFTGLQSVSVDGNVQISTGKTVELTNGGTFYGCYSSQIGGFYDLEVYNTDTSQSVSFYTFYSANTVEKNVTSKLHGGKYGYCNVSSGGSNAVVKGDYTVIMEDLEVTGNCYGIYDMTILGNASVTVDKIRQSSYASLYGIYGCKVQKEAVVAITNSSNGSQSVGISGGTYGMNVEITTENNQFARFYGIQNSVNIMGDVKIITTGDREITAGAGDYYGVQGSSSTIQGNMVMQLDNCSYRGFYGLSSCEIQGKTDIQVNGGAYTDYVVPLQDFGAGKKCGNTTAEFSQVTLGKESAAWHFTNSIYGEALFTCTVDESCTINGTYTVANNYMGNTTFSGGTLIAIGGDRYYAGAYPVTEDVTAENLYFANGTIMQIPEGITMAVADGGMIYAKSGTMLLVEGTLKGSINQKEDCQYAQFYINGGTLETDTENIAYLYYPLKVDYLAKGGKVSPEGCAVHPMSKSNYGRAGYTVSFTCTPNKGYHLTSAMVKKASEDNPSDMAEDAGTSGKYGFDMTKEAAEVEITFTGKQIVLGKTVQDPVAKLNKETTAEKPLYNMKDVTISNDGREGEVTYELDKTFGLPEGLVLADGKIYGTPTKAYEQGKKTVIKVTGKNDTVAALTLNIIVTAGDAGQTGQDGRILIDEENKEINLLGSSVVLENNAGQTAVYLDDNLDGIADRDVPVYQEDLSEYIIYGIKDADFKKSVRITMNGGDVKAIYGSMASEITAADRDAVDIRILGGKINTEVAVVSDTIVDGTVALTIGKDAECTSPVVQKGNSSYIGYYLNRQGIVSIGGSYTLRESLTADSMKVEASSVCTILKEVTLTAEQTTIGSKAELYNDGILNTVNLDASYSSARLYNNGTLNASDIKVGTQAEIRNKGSLSCTGTFNNSGKLVMCSGTIVQEDNEWSGVYYPVTCETELENTKITCSDFYTVNEDDKSDFYAVGGISYAVSCTTAAGFDAYYIVNDTEPVLVADREFSFKMPRQAVSIKIIYVPTDIEVQKQFADPVGVVGCKYTSEEPLYDLTTLNIVNDTNTLYGGNIRYRIANGSALPQGLSLIDGKIVGTPKVADKEGKKVRITVTGRNGTSVDIELLVKIAADDSGQADINNVVTYSGSIMDLHGHSVVICAARGDSKKTSVYLDENRDGIPDSMAGFKINGSMALDLSDVKVYGCQAKDELTDSAQISIHMQGGQVGELHGCYGTKSSPVTVDEVSVIITGGTVYYAVSGATYTSAKMINLDITGGTFKGNVYGANMPNDAGNVHFRFQERAGYEKTNSSLNYRMYAVNGGTVAGNVEAMVGTNENYGFSGRYTNYYGVYQSKINGNVNYTIDGRWVPYVMNQFVYSSTVDGDVNVDWKSGYVTSNGTNTLNFAFVRESTVDELNVRVGEEELAYGDMSMSVGGTIRNLQYYIPDNVKQSPGLILLNTNSKTTINGYAYGYNRGDVQIAGNYTIDKDLDINGLEILKDAKVTIAEGATMTSNSEVIITGTLYNQGTWNCGYYSTLSGMIENEGKLSFEWQGVGTARKAILTIASGGIIVNQETGECYFSSDMSNAGKIVNYGTLANFKSTTGTGFIYTTKLPTLKGSPSNVYYAVSLDYPEYCIDEADITDASGQQLASSGIEGDTNQYLKGGSGFTINTGTVIDGITLSTITYGSDNRAAVTSDYKTWTGTLGKEPTVITLNFDGTVPISLAKTEDNVTGAQVGITSTANNPLYDMTNVEITGDTEIASGYVSYTVDKATPLPEGLSLVKGKIYGTPKKAGSIPQAVKIIVKGKNQTSAVFTLTFDSVAKGTPYLNKPQNLKIDAGASLSTVTLPKYTSPERCAGEYRWKDDTIIPGEAAGTKEIEVEFVPVNTQDYDWSTIANSVYEDGVVTTTIVLTVDKIAPTFEKPEGLTAVYGQTLRDIVLPKDGNGTFSWKENAATPVGDAGEHTFMLTYTPNNTDKYNTVNNIEVVVTVQPAKASFTPLKSVHAVQGDTLADIILPNVEGGRYQWVTQSGIVPENGKSYQVIFKPNDLINYNWAAVPGYSKARRGIVFNVTAVVSPYKVEVSRLPAEITVVYGKPLADVKLPYVRNGKWYLDKQEIKNPVISAEGLPDGAFEWTDGTVVVNTLEDMEVKVNFRSSDKEQYVVENIKVTVKVFHAHSYEDGWIADANNHWKKCKCGNISNKAAHTWNAGTITKQPTATAKGEKTLTCTVCGRKKIVEVPAKGDTEAGKVEKPGTILKDAVTKAQYKVTEPKNGVPQVMYMGITDKKQSSVTIPEMLKLNGISYDVSAIGKNAFKNNKKLKKVVIPKTVRSIGDSAFYGCSGLSSVTIGANVETIGKSAFMNCGTLKKITIPKKVKKIGSKAFYGCKKLTNITIKTSKLTTKTVGSKAFTKAGSKNYKKLVVKVPKSKLKPYKKMLWKRGVSRKAKIKK